jgi:hypothetical protein
MRVRNVCSAALLWSAAILGSGCKGTEPPVATTIVVTPGSVTIATLNATQAFSAQVFDQRGDSIPGQAITWSVDNAAIATVTANGIATAKGNGSATITAATGSLNQTATVTVAQVATAMNKSTGDAQIGTAGVAVTAPLTVHLQDAGGSAIAGATVAFTVASGGGSLVGASTSTNATGDATSGWTLGTVAGSAQAVNVTAGALAATFTATAIAGAVSTVTPQAGNNQTRVTGLPVTTVPSVKVADAFGNAKANVVVIFAVASGNGSVTGATQTTNAQGIATVGSWTMGPAAGANTLSATVQGTAVSFIFTATATTAGAPTTMTVLTASNSQTGLVGYGTNVRPAVTVTDAGGQPVAGVSVTFAVTAGGGSVTNATVNSNAFGIAQVGAWTLGAAAGANSMTATAAIALTGSPATINATGATAAFTVEVQNVGPAFSPAVQAAFDSAAAFWQRAIYGDISDALNFSAAANTCYNGMPAIGTRTVDDVLILARFDSIDGPGQVLGSAGPCLIRNTGALTALGTMRFDTADVAGLVANGSLNAVIRHEMGHVLGFGTLWTQTVFGCRQNGSTPPGTILDTYFSCPRALAAFDSIGGTSYTGGQKVPVENCGPASPAGCGGGTVNSHWREPTFFNEMMTGYLNGGVANPASLLTIAAMEDLAYVVNYGAAEVYNRVFTGPPALRAASSLIDLSGDVFLGPLYAIDTNGRIVRVIRQ